VIVEGNYYFPLASINAALLGSEPQAGERRDMYFFMRR
jgi:hypothetical protein